MVVKREYQRQLMPLVVKPHQNTNYVVQGGDYDRGQLQVSHSDTQSTRVTLELY